MSTWTHLYPAHIGAEPAAPAGTLAQMWSERVASAPEAPALRYFDTVFTARQADELSDALAVEFQERGVRPGDAVGVQLQNVPQFALAMLALWKIGGVALVLNPMYRNVELRTIVTDARPVGVIGVGGDARTAVRRLQEEDSRGWYLRTTDEGLLAGEGTVDPAHASADEDELAAVLEGRLGQRPVAAAVAPEDAALLTYTSGTTGPPKGAVGTHANLLNTAWATQLWLDVRPEDRVLAVAPLFHITGAVATATMSLVSGAELVFIGRLEPTVFLDSVPRYEIHHILGSITVYNALLDLPRGDAEDMRSLRTVFSGGAPVPPATVKRFEERFGHYIRNVYGMTETASAIIGVPLGREAPLDEASGTLAIGVPFPGTKVRVRTAEGALAGPGELGELEVSGASCTPGYLNKPEATASTIEDGWLKTGDVAIIDEDGWVYLVDRKKDQINVSGYKVWPREVEDVIYEHSAVREAAVRGRSNRYSGEEVVAFVSLQSGAALEAEELRAHIRAKLAAYKCPKEVFVIAELPKTATGKIQRRALDADSGGVQV